MLKISAVICLICLCYVDALPHCQVVESLKGVVHRNTINVIYTMESSCKYCARKASMLPNLKTSLRNAGINAHFIVAVSNKSGRLSGLSSHLSINKRHLWKALGEENNHFYVIDRCGRMVYEIINPWSSIQMPFLRGAIIATQFSHPCGLCPQDYSEVKEENLKIYPPMVEEVQSHAEEIPLGIVMRLRHKHHGDPNIYSHIAMTANGMPGHHRHLPHETNNKIKPKPTFSLNFLEDNDQAYEASSPRNEAVSDSGMNSIKNLANNSSNNIKDNPIVNSAPSDKKNNPIVNSAPSDIKDNHVVNSAPSYTKDNPTANSAPSDKKDNPVVNSAPSDKKDNPVVNSTPSYIKDNPIVNRAPSDIKTNSTVNQVPSDMNNNPIVPNSSAPSDKIDNPTINNAPIDIKDNPIVNSAPSDKKYNPIVNNAPSDIKDNPTVNSAPNDIKDNPVVNSAPSDKNTEIRFTEKTKNKEKPQEISNSREETLEEIEYSDEEISGDDYDEDSEESQNANENSQLNSTELAEKKTLKEHYGRILDWIKYDY